MSDFWSQAGAGNRSNGSRTIQKAVNLALQGGGSHGAFAWGVLDRLLEDGRITIDGISATSAGAMNAVTLAYGWAIGGPDGARRSLAEFWQRIGKTGSFSWLQPSWFERIMPSAAFTFSPVFVMLDLITRIFSPYEFNPLNINPLREALTATVDFEVLRSPDCPIKLFLCASNVRTGKIKVFERDTICVDRVMASACLPQLFQAVEIDGEHYWDGGYMGNPAMFPLIYNCTSRDIVLIRINPLSRPQVPRTAAEILNRINEISFNSSLIREMRVMNFVTGLIDSGQLSEPRFRRMLVHSISADQEMTKLGPISKLNVEMRFLERLRDVGRRRAEAWLADKFDSLSRESTIELEEEFL